MLILGIETSCDETGVALYDGDKGLLGHEVYSQVAMHAEYGGVVPELASRDHVRKLLPLAETLLARLGIERRVIDGVAYTAGPGLAGALLVGAAVGRSIAWAWNVPDVGRLPSQPEMNLLQRTPSQFFFFAQPECLTLCKFLPLDPGRL